MARTQEPWGQGSACYSKVQYTTAPHSFTAGHTSVYVCVRARKTEASRCPESTQEGIRSPGAGWSYSSCGLCAHDRSTLSHGANRSLQPCCCGFPLPYLEGCQCVRDICLIKVPTSKPRCKQLPCGHLFEGICDSFASPVAHTRESMSLHEHLFSDVSREG